MNDFYLSIIGLRSFKAFTESNNIRVPLPHSCLTPYVKVSTKPVSNLKTLLNELLNSDRVMYMSYDRVKEDFIKHCQDLHIDSSEVLSDAQGGFKSMSIFKRKQT